MQGPWAGCCSIRRPTWEAYAQVHRVGWGGQGHRNACCLQAVEVHDEVGVEGGQVEVPRVQGFSQRLLLLVQLGHQVQPWEQLRQCPSLKNLQAA